MIACWTHTRGWFGKVREPSPRESVECARMPEPPQARQDDPRNAVVADRSPPVLHALSAPSTTGPSSLHAWSHSARSIQSERRRRPGYAPQSRCVGRSRLDALAPRRRCLRTEDRGRRWRRCATAPIVFDGSINPAGRTSDPTKRVHPAGRTSDPTKRVHPASRNALRVPERFLGRRGTTGQPASR